MGVGRSVRWRTPAAVMPRSVRSVPMPVPRALAKASSRVQARRNAAVVSAGSCEGWMQGVARQAVSGSNDQGAPVRAEGCRAVHFEVDADRALRSDGDQGEATGMCEVERQRCARQVQACHVGRSRVPSLQRRAHRTCAVAAAGQCARDGGGAGGRVEGRREAAEDPTTFRWGTVGPEPARQARVRYSADQGPRAKSSTKAMF